MTVLGTVTMDAFRQLDLIIETLWRVCQSGWMKRENKKLENKENMNDQPSTFDPNKQYWGCNVDPYGEIHIFEGTPCNFLSAIGLYYLEWYSITDRHKIRLCDHTYELFDTEEECAAFIYGQEMEKLAKQINDLFYKRSELQKQLNERLSSSL